MKPIPDYACSVPPVKPDAPVPCDGRGWLRAKRAKLCCESLVFGFFAGRAPETIAVAALLSLFARNWFDALFMGIVALIGHFVFTLKARMSAKHVNEVAQGKYTLACLRVRRWRDLLTALTAAGIRSEAAQHSRSVRVRLRAELVRLAERVRRRANLSPPQASSQRPLQARFTSTLRPSGARSRG